MEVENNSRSYEPNEAHDGLNGSLEYEHHVILRFWYHF